MNNLEKTFCQKMLFSMAKILISKSLNNAKTFLPLNIGIGTLNFCLGLTKLMRVKFLVSGEET